MRSLIFAPETFNLAEVTRGIEVAKRLPEFHCLFVGFSDTYVDEIRRAGFEFRPLAPRLTDEQAESILAFDQGKRLRFPFTEEDIRWRVRSELEVLEEIAPEAVVIGSTVSQFISARVAGVPLIYVKPFAYSAPRLASMRTTGMLPRDNAVTRAVDGAVARVARTVVPRIRYRPRFLCAVAAEHGLELPSATVRLLEADLNLVTTVPELLPEGTVLPPHYRAVGPVYANLEPDVASDIREVLEGPDRVVYFALGSSGNRDLALAVLNGLQDVEVPVVAPVRHYLRDEDLVGWPDHIHITGWLPTKRLAGRVAVAITHGGEGTVQTSCTNGWPFIGIPLQLEQRYNIVRCVDAGNARLVGRRAVGRTDWSRLVSQVLADGSMTAAAREMAEFMQSMDGPGIAAERSDGPFPAPRPARPAPTR